MKTLGLKISYAISADPIVSRPYLEQFWDIADHDCTITPNVIRATVTGHDIAISEDTIRRVLQFRDLATDPVSYPNYFVDGCWRQRMGYVGVRDYASYKKMWLLDQWRYIAHIMIMCICSRKAGKDAMGHDLAAAMVGLFLLYPRFVQLLINDALPNLPAIGERLQVKRVAKRVFSQFLTPGSVEPTPEHTPLFGHLINKAYVTPPDLRWYSPELEPELSEHSNEQGEEEVEGDDDSEEEGDEEEGSGGAEESDLEATESDSSDSDDAPSQSHPRRMTKVTLPKSSSKRKRQESTSSDYEPDSDSDAALQRQRRESINKRRRDRPFQAILSEVEASAQRHATSTSASTDSTSTSPSQQLYRRQRMRPCVTVEVAATSITEEVPVIVTLPMQSVQVAVMTLILTDEHFPDFDFDELFTFPAHTAKASSSRGTDPRYVRISTLETQVDGLLETVWISREESEKQQGQINSLVDEVAALRKQRVTDEKQCQEHDAMVKLVCDMAKTLAAQGERLKELLDKRPLKPSSVEACHLMDLTKGDDQDKDPEAGPSGSEQQSSTLAIVPISTVPMAEGEFTRSEGGGDASGHDKGNNLEEGEIDSGDDWDEEDEDVVIEFPKGDGEGEYEFEDGEIFEAPTFEANFDTCSVEPECTAEASTEASPTDPKPVDPEALKSKYPPGSSPKDQAPGWQKTSIIDKH
ncbi:hypothetical protein L1987_70923 [Smallanthus sonchifolius]|uniref:Uncharacterized protein n=1 Tax=Smallanthus sonchifolius TaxID=185202 RepID=A0ACB9AQN5_9ASTR|nr:hypothetical protein L1987_70923 [Smallanthus sonchifolius]